MQKAPKHGALQMRSQVQKFVHPILDGMETHSGSPTKEILHGERHPDVYEAAILRRDP